MFLEDHPDYLDFVCSDNISYPTAISIEVTTFCNLKCIMCPKTSGIARTPGNRKMDDQILDKIIRQIFPHISRIDLVGDGEILLELNMVRKILSAAKKYRILVNASTNGILLTDEAARVLVQERLHDLNISLDAASASTYKAIRGADWELLIANIRHLNEIKEELNLQTPFVHYSLVGMNRNIAEFPELVELAHRTNAVSVLLQAMGEFDPVKNQSIFLRNKSTGLSYYKKALDLGRSLGISVELWPEDQFRSTEHSQESSVEKSLQDELRKDCDFPWTVPYIATDGTVRPCCAMPPVGSLETADFKDIWWGAEYQKLRSALKSNSPPQICRACPGRGWYSPTVPRNFISPSENFRQFPLGLSNIENSAAGEYRWLTESNVFFLGDDHAKILSLEIASNPEEAVTRNLELTVDNTESFSIYLDPGTHTKMYFPIRDPGRKVHSFKLTGKPWRPVDVIPESLDSRRLTVKFFGASVFGREVEAEFAHGIRLVAIDYDPADASIPLTCFWEIKNNVPENLRIFLHFYRPSSLPFKVSALLQEVQRKLHRPVDRFQVDAFISLHPTSNGLLRSQIPIDIPTKRSAGKRLIILGLYSPEHRLQIKNAIQPVYRNGVIVGDIQF